MEATDKVLFQKNQNNVNELSYPDLPEWDLELPPGYLIIYGGKRRSGKSFHIRYLLSTLPRDFYKMAIVMTRTPQTNAFQGLVGPEWVHPGWNPALARQYMEAGAKNVDKNGEGHKDNRMLLIMDDIIGGEVKDIHNDHVIDDMATLGRHYDIDVIITTQYPHALSPRVRNNCDLYIGFEVSGKMEFDSVINTYCYRLGDFRAAAAVYERYTEGYKAFVALRHIRERDIVKRYNYTLAPEEPVKDFPIGCEVQQKSAIAWTKARKSKSKSTNSTTDDVSDAFKFDGFRGWGDDGDVLGPSFGLHF